MQTEFDEYILLDIADKELVDLIRDCFGIDEASNIGRAIVNLKDATLDVSVYDYYDGCYHIKEKFKNLKSLALQLKLSDMIGEEIASKRKSLKKQLDKIDTVFKEFIKQI